MSIVTEYQLEGHINARPVLGIGRGLLDPDSGVGEMEVEFKRLAPGWDPRTIVLMCCERRLAMSSREEKGAVGMLRASGGYLTIGRHLVNSSRIGNMRDAQGNVMVSVEASSETDLREGRGWDRSRIEGGISHLRYGINGIASVKPFSGLMQQAGPNVVTLSTTYEATLEDGSTLYGYTFYPHFLPEQKVVLTQPQLWRLEEITQEFDGRRLWVRTRTSVTLLSEAPAYSPVRQPSRELRISGAPDLRPLGA